MTARPPAAHGARRETRQVPVPTARATAAAQAHDMSPGAGIIRGSHRRAATPAPRFPRNLPSLP